MKRHLLAAGTAFLALATAVPAFAQGLTFSYGATATTNYVSRGATNSNDRPAFQPWVEIESNGFYGGLWASNVAGFGESVEVDVYGGYRWSMENTSFDFGYARYFYNNSGDAGGEFYALVEHAAGDVTLFGGAYFGHAGGLTLNDVHGGFSFPLVAGLSGSMQFGRATGGANYGDVGVSYSFNDNFDIDLRYHHGAGIGRNVVLSVSAAF